MYKTEEGNFWVEKQGICDAKIKNARQRGT